MAGANRSPRDFSWGWGGGADCLSSVQLTELAGAELKSKETATSGD